MAYRVRLWRAGLDQEADAQHDPQDAAHLFVKPCFGVGAIGQAFGEGLVEIHLCGLTAHFQIDARRGGLVGIMDTGPIADHQPLKAPFIFQQGLQ